MKIVRAIFIGGYRIGHACVSLQFDHNIKGIDHTYIVTPFDNDRMKKIFESYNIDTSNMTWIHDDVLLTKYPEIKKWNNLPGDYRGTWLLQQGLKLAILDYLEDADVVLIQDPDTFCVQPYECIVDNKPNLFYLPDTSHSAGYYSVLKNTLNIERQTQHCFVSELMPMLRKDWLSLKDRAENFTGKNVWDAIIDGVPYEGYENLKWFSEFEFLGNWMLTVRPCLFTEQRRFEYKSLSEIDADSVGDYHNCICDAVPKLNDSILLNYDTDKVIQFDFVISRLAPLLDPSNVYYKKRPIELDLTRYGFIGEPCKFKSVIVTNIARNPVFSISPALPRGLVFDKITGDIVGVPEEVDDKEYTITVTDNITQVERHSIRLCVRKRIKVYNYHSKYSIFIDWFGKQTANSVFVETSDINEVVEQDVRIGCFPYWATPDPSIFKDLDLILLSYNEAIPISEAISWAEKTFNKPFLYASGSHNFETELPSNVIYRPWWMFNTIENNGDSDTKQYNQNPEYDFDILLGAKKSHRDFIMALLQKNNMLDNNIVTYRDLFTAPPQLHDDLEIATDLLLQGEPLKYPYQSPNLNSDWEVDNLNKAVSGIVPWKIYEHTKYSIIAETLPSFPFFFTEKPTKAMLAKRVFIPFACRHYLKAIRDMGFKTFDTVIDESYDEIVNDIQRFNAAFKQIKILSAMDYQEVMDKTHDIREHNFNRLITYRQEIRKRMTDMVYNKLKEIKHANSIF